MIELDTYRSLEMIDSIVKLHYVDLPQAYHAKDYHSIQRILGDNDWLGYQKIYAIHSPYFMFHI
jgi:hypothetical protein